MDRFENLIRCQQRSRLILAVKVTALLGVVFASCYQVDLFNWERIAQGVPDFFGTIAEMLPPDFSRAREWVEPLLDTLAMSIAGTAIAIVLSLPLALCGARNTTPHFLAYLLARGLLNLARAIPELILGMVLVAAVGFGKLPGTLALGLHSVGMVGKFCAEAIELADRAPIEATRAVGATELQVIAHGIWPQVLPQVANLAFYRWEYNFRASIVLGAVGAGGIGMELIAALRILQYQQVSALLIVILALVAIVDGCSNYLRQQFV